MKCNTVLPTIVAFFFLFVSFAAKAEPLQIVRGVHPVLTVTIDGKRTAQMLLDTGAGQTHLAKAFARKGDLADICLTKTLCFKDVKVFTGENTYNQPIAGYYNGLIGWDILSKLVTTIDYQAATVEFQSKATEIKVPFTLDKGGRPQASFKIAGVEMGNLLLDTGGSYVRVTKAQRLRLGKSFVPSGKEFSFTVKSAEKTTMASPVKICTEKACGTSILQEAVWPAVGGSFFRNFRVTIDGPNQVFWLDPVQAPPLKTTVDRYGFQLSATNAADILFVEEGSLAAKSGMTDKDLLISINEKSVTDLGYLGVLAILDGNPESGVTLGLLDDKTIKTVKLKPSNP